MPIQIGNSRLNSADETAQILGVKVGTVKKYVRDGILKGKRMGKDFWITGDSIDQLPQGYRNRKRPSRGAVQIFKAPLDGPFTPQPSYHAPDERLEFRAPGGGISDWSFWDFTKQTLFVVSIIACQFFSFIFSWQGAKLYMQEKYIYYLYSLPIDCALGFALITQLGILCILFTLNEKSQFQGLMIYFFLAFLAIYSAYVFALNESTNSTRLDAVKKQAGVYLGGAKTNLGKHFVELSETVEKINGDMALEANHGSGVRGKGEGFVWQTLDNKKKLYEQKLQFAQANLERYEALALEYNEKSANITDPNELKAMLYQISLQMPSEATTAEGSYAAIFKVEGIETLPHQRAWKALFSRNKSERNHAIFTFFYSGLFEFIAFALAIYRVSRRFSLEEKVDGIVSTGTHWAAKVRSWENLEKEVEHLSDDIKKQRPSLSTMEQQNQHDEKTLKHLDKHVKNNNKAKEILSRKQ